MWKVTLGFIVQRLILMATLFLCINTFLIRSQPEMRFHIFSMKEVYQSFETRLSNTTTVSEIEKWSSYSLGRMVQETSNVHHWIIQATHVITHASVSRCILFTFGIFFLLFLFECYFLFSRIGTESHAVEATLLLLFWVPSYESLIGSGHIFEALITVSMLRMASDSKWFVAGPLLALLAISDPRWFLWVPFLMGVFYYKQRHFFAPQIIRQAFFALLPLLGVVVIHKFSWQDPMSVWNDSIAFQVASIFKSPTWGLNWSIMAPLTSLTLLIVGTLAILPGYVDNLYRVLAITMFVFVIGTSSSQSIASNLYLAPLCFYGVSNLMSPIIHYVVRSVFLTIAGLELFRLFAS